MEPLCGVQMRDKEVIVWEGRKYHTDWHHVFILMTYLASEMLE